MEELAKAYEESAKQIAARLDELREELETTDDPEIKWQLKRRIATLTPILTEANKLSDYCRHYYDKGYYIGDGPFGRKRNGHGKASKHRRKNDNYNQ